MYYFRNRMFEGNVLQSLDLTLRDCNMCVTRHRLTPIQKANLYINELDEKATTFSLYKFDGWHELRRYG